MPLRLSIIAGLFLVTFFISAFNAYAIQPSLAAGNSSSYVVTSDGDLWAWGSDLHGQLGDGEPREDKYHPVLIGTDYEMVAARRYHVVALKKDGSVWCWGANGNGQVGDGTTTDRYEPIHVGSDFTFVAAAGTTSFALKSDGTVWAWGGHGRRLFPDGSDNNLYVPTKVGDGFSSIFTGRSHVLAFKRDDASVWGWGNNDYGCAIAKGGFSDGAPPTQLNQNYVDLAAGFDCSFGIDSKGRLFAWGDNGSGRLGDGTEGPSTTPVLIGTDFKEICSASLGTTALKRDGSLWAWGSSGLTLYRTKSPIKIGESYQKIAKGKSHALALHMDGNLYALGYNNHGCLGIGEKRIGDKIISPVSVNDGFTVSGVPYEISITDIKETGAFGGMLTLSGTVRTGASYPLEPAPFKKIVAYSDALSQQCTSDFAATDAEGNFTKTYSTEDVSPGLYHLSLGVLDDQSSDRFGFNIPIATLWKTKEIRETADLNNLEFTIRGVNYEFLDVLTKSITSTAMCAELVQFEPALRPLAERMLDSFVSETVKDIVSNPGMWVAAPVAVVTCLAPEPSSKVVCAASVVYMKQAVAVSVAKSAAKTIVEQSNDEVMKERLKLLIDGADVAYSVATLDPAAGFSAAQIPDLATDSLQAGWSIIETSEPSGISSVRKNTAIPPNGASVIGKTESGKFIIVTFAQTNNVSSNSATLPAVQQLLLSQ